MRDRNFCFEQWIGVARYAPATVRRHCDCVVRRLFASPLGSLLVDGVCHADAPYAIALLTTLV